MTVVATRRKFLPVIIALSTLSVISILSLFQVIPFGAFNSENSASKNRQEYSNLEFIAPTRLEPTDEATESDRRVDSSSLELPDFENGGIMIFYHLYKTGGSTVVNLLTTLAVEDEEDRFVFRRMRKMLNWRTSAATTALDLAVNERKVVMYELHVQYPAPGFPTLVEAAPILARWRAEAGRLGVPFFAFTVLREPEAHAISFFNFFHVTHSKADWNPYHPFAPTEENFLKSFQGNRQCHFMDTDADGIVKVPEVAVKRSALPHRRYKRHQLGVDDSEECHYRKVRAVLFGVLDWVGTTEQLQEETLPLLSMILLNSTEVGRNIPPKKVFSESDRGADGLKREELSESTLALLERETKLDRWLYNEARDRFSFVP
jgi:hypothetical protein